MPTENQTTKHHVSGRVTDIANVPQDGLLIRVYDRDMRNEELIGETYTGRDGLYDLPYIPAKFLAAEKKYPDLAVKVYTAEGGKLLYEPPMREIRFNARKREVVNIRLQQSVQRANDEYTRHLNDIKPLRGEVGVEGLDESDKVQDISFLNREAGIRTDRLEYLVVAHRLQAQFDLPTAVSYGLFRMGTLLNQGATDLLRMRTGVNLDDDLKVLVYDMALLDPRRATDDLRKAADRNIIPAQAVKQYNQTQEILSQYREEATRYQQEEKPGKVLNILAGLVTGDKINLIQDLFTSSHGDMQAFVTSLKDKRVFETKDDQQNAEVSLQLGSLLGYNKEITDEVIKAAEVKKTDDLRKLVGYTAKDWKGLLAKVKTGGREAGRVKLTKKAVELHARTLAKNLEARYPAEAYLKHMQADSKLSKDDKEITAFLNKQKKFNLKETSVDTYFKEKKLNKEKDEKLKSRLKKHQRLLRLNIGYEQAKKLNEHKIHSAQGIVAAGRGRFINEIAPEAGLSEDQAETIFRKAEATHAATLMVAADLRDMREAAIVPALSDVKLMNKLASVEGDFPTLKTLFQLTDMCECEHCRSVYSPAAYMVELLQFLDKRKVKDLEAPITFNNAKDALFERRPDLGDLDLSCDNANVPVPYIDLVCEILEEVVSPDKGFDYGDTIAEGGISNNLLNELTAAGYKVTDRAQIFPQDVNGDYTLRDKQIVLKIHSTGGGNWNIKELRQTYGTAAELAAAPYHVNADAYDVLKKAVYAFGLPFDLDHAEASAYFERFGIGRADLMKALQSSGNPADIAIATERLGLTTQEKNIIVTIDSGNQASYWNTQGTVLADMRVVKNMLDKTGLTYKELEEMLEMAFHPGDLFIRHLDESCDLTQKRIENLTAAGLDKIHRILRLRKATGWSFPLIDALLTQSTLGNGSLNEACLIKLGRLVEIKDRTGLKIEELAGCYGEIPHTLTTNEKYVPLYQKVFLNKAVNGTIDESLLPENITDSGDIADQKTSVSLALQISEEDFDRLYDTLADTSLSWANLSYLYASARLCAKRKVSIKDYLIYRELTGLQPFASPADTLAFLDYLDKAKHSALSASDVKFMLRHEAEDLDQRIINDEKIEEILEVLQEVYAQAYIAGNPPYHNEMSVEELSVLLKQTLLRVPEVTEEAAANIVSMALGTYQGTNPEAETIIDEGLSFYLDTNPVKAARSAIDDSEDNTDPTASATKYAFIDSILDPLLAFLYLVEKEEALLTTLSQAYRQDRELVNAALLSSELGQPGGSLIYDLLTDDSLIDTTDPETYPTIDEATYGDQYSALRLLHKMLPLVDSLNLPAADVEWWLQNAGPVLMEWLQPDHIPYTTGQSDADYDAWLALSGMAAVSKNYPDLENPADPERPYTFTGALDQLIDGIGTAEWLDQVAVITAYDREQVEALHNHFSWSVDDYKDPDTWHRLEKCMGYIRKMNITVDQAVEASKATLEALDAATLRAALKTRYSGDLWLETLKEIMNAIRPQKRDALVAYILAENANMTTTADLYDHYLVDVEMEACMPSSRIVQAHGVIQLFAQRCLMGLELNTAADTEADPGWDQWKWMKMYRVWEANRKVFLYPENWIAPELLDDKSFLFSDLENTLLQNELNEFTAEDAVIRYVEALDEISFLEVMASYYEKEAYTMHVFARSKGGDPPQYYYRRFESERYWTPWEKVPLEITANQVVAFKRNSRLHLAWPIFSEEPNPNQNIDVPPMDANGSTQGADENKPEKRLRIQLAISQYANKQWKPKKVSQDAITGPYSISDADLNHDVYNLIYNPLFDRIAVFHTNMEGNNEYHRLDGLFDIAGCKGYPELIADYDYYVSYPDFFPDILDAHLRPQRYFERQHLESPDSLVIFHVLSFLGLHDRLNNTPGKFRITHPFQFNLFDLIAWIFMMILKNALGKLDILDRYFKVPLGTLFPYFFEDSNHAYVAIPGLYGEQDNAEGEPVPVRRTFSDIRDLLDKIGAIIQKYIQIYQENQDVNATMEQLQNDPDYLYIVEELNIYKTLSVGEDWRNLYYPLMCNLRKVLYNDGVEGIMKREFQLQQIPFDFGAHYQPFPQIVQPYPVEDFDFTSQGSYSGYNWELFYHTPLMIANRLRDDQKFDEAFTWYHYMFNPTGTLAGSVPNKFWVTKPFYQHTTADYIYQRIDTLLYKVATPGTPEIAELEFAIEEWRDKPFRPHTVARFRPVAYQKTLLMNYLQALIDCGDYHFRMDTMESIVQATQYYMLAHKLLGDKPRVVPPVARPPYQTYNQIEADLDAFGNALVELENLIPDITTLPQGGAELPPVPQTLSSLYFCIPLNDKMLGYWDTIDDRLWKIRNCRNIDGVERTLALFAPPIDPGALVKAAAAGLDISAVIAGMNAPLPHYRFMTLAQKATELVQEVRSLGSSLLQALEKKDAEEMSLLQNSLERKVLKHMRDIKKLQIQESVEQIEVLNKSKETTQERFDYYANIERIIANEQLNLDKLSEGQDFQMASQIVQATGAILGLIPDFNIGGHGAGGSPAFHATFGGSNLAEAANAAASVLNILSSAANYEANRASILGGYDRRWEDWKLQERTADKELKHLDQQIVVAEITKQRNEKDLENHDIQIENSEQTEAFMRDKYTNKDLYQWMISEITSVYYRAYKMAYDMAKKAEKSYQHELGTTDTFIDFGYWDSLKKGLLASDQLLHDLKRMEVGYYDSNKREYEVTKHISLDMLDPLALIKLRSTGSCDFEVPEALYDMDHPGHYFRRIKSVSISIPCIAGPYTSVAGKLSLVANKVRKNTAKAQGAASPLEEYQEDPGNDPRFLYNIGTIQSIATSGAQNDSGLFEMNFRDERFLPFEGAGAVGTWRFELPEIQQFDYQTIRDVILHVKYTAREGGSTLRNLASSTLAETADSISQELSKTGMHKAISLRHEMPNEWHMLKTEGEALPTITKDRLPYFTQPLSTSISNVVLIARVAGAHSDITIQVDDADLTLGHSGDWELCINETNAISLDTQFKLNLAEGDKANLQDLILVVKYEF
ncbi:neuraminidase-like domain-containing protein [Roseivirga sp. BDSF3-8]|uniref:Tc toxin subunit A-related protein n=1 Tax=Roseivirga sp. BDSF3-8 TaxID=3241598 RepID=UPI0035325026